MGARKVALCGAIMTVTRANYVSVMGSATGVRKQSNAVCWLRRSHRHRHILLRMPVEECRMSYGEQLWALLAIWLFLRLMGFVWYDLLGQ